MASIALILLGIVIGVGAMALVQMNKSVKNTQNICPQCTKEAKERAEEETQLKKDWEDQQKGY